MRYLFLWMFVCSLVFADDSLDQSLREHIHYDAQGPNQVGYLYIGGHEDQISQGTYIYVKNALEYFKNTVHPAFIILELDTPGGQVFPAQKISDALKEMDTNFDIPVVAFINNWAMSAGAMLAYSCRYIVTVKDGSMGAAKPVTTTGEATSEKVNSAIRTDFAGRAGFFDRNGLVAEAMVDPDIVLVVRDKKIVELGSDDQILPTDTVISRKGKLVTLNSEQMVDLGVANLRLLPHKLAEITEQEKAAGEWPAAKMLLFTYPFFEQIPGAVIKAYQMDWKTRFFTFLSNPVVSSLLLLGLIIGFYIEISTPGFGVAGGIAVICLSLIILANFALQASGWLELIFLVVGVGLILFELFVIPGFGVAGVIGIVLTLVGLFGLLLPGLKEVHFDFDTGTLNAAGQYVLERLAWLSGAVILGVVVMAFLARYIVPRLSLFSPLVHHGSQEAGKGYVAGHAAENLPPIGSEGIVVSPLRTAGKVEIEGTIYDAVSSGSFIDKGEKIQVIGIEGSKIIVEERA